MRRSFRFFLPVFFLIFIALSGCSDNQDVGAYCESDRDCRTSQCYTKHHANYCTTGCDTEGSTSQCPDYTVCKKVHGGPHRCLLTCQDDTQCPTGSDCEDVKHTSLRACEPED